MISQRTPTLQQQPQQQPQDTTNPRENKTYDNKAISNKQTRRKRKYNQSNDNRDRKCCQNKTRTSQEQNKRERDREREPEKINNEPATMQEENYSPKRTYGRTKATINRLIKKTQQREIYKPDRRSQILKRARERIYNSSGGARRKTAPRQKSTNPQKNKWSKWGGNSKQENEPGNAASRKNQETENATQRRSETKSITKQEKKKTIRPLGLRGNFENKQKQKRNHTKTNLSLLTQPMNQETKTTAKKYKRAKKKRSEARKSPRSQVNITTTLKNRVTQIRTRPGPKNDTIHPDQETRECKLPIA